MSDTSTADFSAAGESVDYSEGFDADLLGENTLYDSDYGTSDGPSEESQQPIDALFEVDGSPITLDEARNGYLRQSDYTKKTQELAEMRQRLSEAEAIVEALRSDPNNTLRALGDAFGVNLSGDQDDSFFDEMDAGEQRIALLEQKIAAQEQAATQAAIEAELNDLKGQYGEFDESTLFAHAIKGGFPNLRSAYADMNFGETRARLAELERRQQEQEKKIAAKRELASTVHNGASRNGATAPNNNAGFGSLREAYLAAKKSLNG